MKLLSFLADRTVASLTCMCISSQTVKPFACSDIIAVMKSIPCLVPRCKIKRACALLAVQVYNEGSIIPYEQSGTCKYEFLIIQ